MYKSDIIVSTWKQLLVTVCMLFSFSALAQFDSDIPLESESPSSESAELDMIEAELQRAVPANQTGADGSRAEEKRIENITDLKTLAPFSEVSVIQRRFLPKTGRFQLFVGFSSIVNDPWFTSIGASLKGAYHLTESWGIELTASGLGTTERQSVLDLKNENAVQTSSIISTKSYTGLSLMWIPIYGKTTIFNERIVPFDMYFAVGGGSTGLSAGSGGSTLQVSTGQMYAISKGTALRWDFTWNSFSAQPPGGESQSFNNLMLNLGVSFFVPEAKYR